VRELLRRLCGVLFLVLLARRLLRMMKSSPQGPPDSRVLVTFSGSGLLWAYYSGVACYLQENFELQDVRFAGISQGSNPASVLALGLSAVQAFQIGLVWAEVILKRRLKFYLINPEEMIVPGLATCDEFGITDEHVRTLHGKGRCYYGTTDLSVFPFQHVLLSDATSIKESLWFATASMRVLPFFDRFALLKGMCLVDGGFSAMYSIPPGASPERTIRVSPFSFMPGANIKPLKGQDRPWQEIFYTRSRKQLLAQVRAGYMDSMRVHSDLVARGLQEKPSYLPRNSAHLEKVVANFDRVCLQFGKDNSLPRTSSFFFGASTATLDKLV